MGAMSSITPLSGLVVCLDDVEIDDLVGAVEVLVQEGFRNFSLPVGSEAFAEFSDIYSGRARIGAHGVVSADEVARTAELGGVFCFLDLPDPEALATAAEAGLAGYAQAMTPTEIRDVLAAGAQGAMVYPADVLGHIMAARLRAVGLADRVVPRGGVGAYAAGEWLKAGAPAACVDAPLLSDSLHGGDLGSLRDRCGSFIKVQDKHASS